MRHTKTLRRKREEEKRFEIKASEKLAQNSPEIGSVESVIREFETEYVDDENIKYISKHLGVGVNSEQEPEQDYSNVGFEIVGWIVASIMLIMAIIMLIAFYSR